jgi:TPR repeat protein
MPTDFGGSHMSVLAGDAALASGDYMLALNCYGAAAEMGLAAGQHNLGLLYQEGKGVRVDYAEAMKWYRKAADQGAPISQAAVGLMYYHGQGVQRDYAEALKWLRAAAEQGFTVAEFTVGQMYGNGIGVERNLREAVKWFDRAAQKGHPGAIAAARQARDMAAFFDEAEKAGAIVGGAAAVPPATNRLAAAGTETVRPQAEKVAVRPAAKQPARYAPEKRPLQDRFITGFLFLFFLCAAVALTAAAIVNPEHPTQAIVGGVAFTLLTVLAYLMI